MWRQVLLHGWCNRREPLPLFFLFVAELACSFRMSSENLPTKRFKNTGVPPHSGEKMAVLSWPACCLCWSHQGDFHHTTLGKEAAWIRQPTVSKRKTHSGLQTSTVALLHKGLIQTHVGLARSNPTKITTLKRQLHAPSLVIPKLPDYHTSLERQMASWHPEAKWLSTSFEEKKRSETLPNNKWPSFKILKTACWKTKIRCSRHPQWFPAWAATDAAAWRSPCWKPRPESILCRGSWKVNLIQPRFPLAA